MGDVVIAHQGLWDGIEEVLVVEGEALGQPLRWRGIGEVNVLAVKVALGSEWATSSSQIAVPLPMAAMTGLRKMRIEG